MSSKIALLFILSGLVIFSLTFVPVAKEEINYQFNPPATAMITPVDTDFGIVIPKINANAKIFSNINPFSEKEFLPILKKGVAHAISTGFPGQGKNIYLFAHSADAFYNVGRYNAVFYLIGKLEPGDEINLFYFGQRYRYLVYEKKVVFPSAINYLQPTEGEILTLQTCYPPGTTLKRLIIRAK